MPFYPEKPCSNVQEYIGREALTHQAFSRLGTDDVQSFAVIGFHKFGKSSFAKHIQQPEIVKRYLKEKADQYFFVYIDVLKKNLNNEIDFFHELYKQIEALLGLSELEDITDLEEVTDWLNENNKQLVLIFDNFNLIVTNNNYSLAFYEGLRSWFSTNYKIGCVVTSPLQLLHLAIPIGVSGSPFFNIFDSYFLHSLTLSEAFKLLETSLPNKLKYNQKQLIKITTYVGLNPYELQKAGAIWVSNSELVFDDILEKIYQNCKPYYEYIYSDLTHKQRENIKSLIDPSYKTNARMDNKLITYGWVTEDGKELSSLQMERFFDIKMNPPTWIEKIIKKIKEYFGCQ